MVAPLAVKVVDMPLQMVVLVGVSVNTGTAFTVMVAILAALTQPPLEPVTVYTVVEEGLTTLAAPDPDGSQVYVVAPLAVSVVDPPLQMAVLVGVMVREGTAFTVIVSVLAVLLQLPLEPVTVYMVVEDGLTTLVAPEPDGSQV